MLKYEQRKVKASKVFNQRGEALYNEDGSEKIEVKKTETIKTVQLSAKQAAVLNGQILNTGIQYVLVKERAKKVNAE